MRLTLRTMLAYLDNVLEPADAEELGQKINESDFASGLVQRVRGVMKKLRMDAPRLDGKGMGGDANTVAEYLDSSLPQDRVGDFERICLESDKHLCEVAACHQILTLVLGKPADVPLELRERLYALGHPDQLPPSLHAPTAADADAKISPPPVLGPNGQAARPAPMQVPEYLRSRRGANFWPLVGAAAAGLLIVAVVVGTLSLVNRNHPLFRLLRGEGQIAANTSENASAEKSSAPAESGTARVESLATTTPAPSGDSEKTLAEAKSSDVALTVVAPAASPADATLERLAAAPLDKSAETAPAPQPPAATIPDEAAPAVPMPPAPMPPAAKVPRPPQPVPKAPARPVPELGRYISDGQVLATLDPDDGLWYLKPLRAGLTAGERLVALPAFRPQVALPSGVLVTFAGDGAVRMEQPGESGASRMTVDYGRLLVVTAGAAGAQIELDLAGVKGVATLVDADSALAIKVAHWLPPGTSPEAMPSMPVVEIFNTNGRITWQEEGEKKEDVPSHQVRVYIGADPPEAYGPFVAPDWIDAKSIAPIDRDASRDLERLIDPSKALNLTLQEATTHRRVEVRALAARCLTSLDEFEPVLRELADSRQYSYWPVEVDALRQALSRGPETVAKVKAALDHNRGGEAKDLYRLLWGYGQDQLEKGAAAQLVKFLEHEHMDVRVLTYCNLMTITGAGEYYRPEKPPAQSRPAIQNWKDRLNKGLITYKLPPTPLENYKPLAAPTGAGPAAEARPGFPGAARGTQ